MNCDCFCGYDWKIWDGIVDEKKGNWRNYYHLTWVCLCDVFLIPCDSYYYFAVAAVHVYSSSTPVRFSVAEKR